MQVNFIPTIHTSSNYDNFSLLPSNREPKHWRKIAESVKERNLLPYVPILVTEKNGKLEIFDGQNRFLAAKSLLLPVHYFIIKDATPTDMIRLNLGQTEWDNHAFLKYYVQYPDSRNTCTKQINSFQENNQSEFTHCVFRYFK